MAPTPEELRPKQSVRLNEDPKGGTDSVDSTDEPFTPRVSHRPLWSFVPYNSIVLALVLETGLKPAQTVAPYGLKMSLH